MKPLFTILPLIVFALTLHPLFASQAQACTCMPPAPPTQMLERADAVFVATVTSVSNQDAHTLRIHLEVEENFKGLRASPGDPVEIFTATSSAACGYSFRPGSTYLLYGYFDASSGRLFTNLCTRNLPASSPHFQQERDLLREATADFAPEQGTIDASPAAPPETSSEEPRQACPAGLTPVVTAWVCALPYTGPEGPTWLNGSALPTLCFLAGTSRPESWRCQAPQPTLR